MKVGLFFWGTVWMAEAGHAAPHPYSHQFPPETYAGCFHDLLEWAKLADQTGFESFWVTEHHFQREGYQVVPNVLMTSAVMAQHTRHLKFGAMVHPMPTWHPLRFAEDFAIADILTGGRLIFGAGRGSVDREARVFGSAVSRKEDEANAENRKLFEEQMDIIKQAWTMQPFSHHGPAYRIPAEGATVTGAPDGAPYDQVTVIPAPMHPVEIWQALNSKDTADYAARHGHRAVISYVGSVQDVLGKWELYGKLAAEYRERPFRRGEDRVLVIRAHVGDSKAAAMEAVRPSHDERFRFLGAQRPIFGYRDQEGSAFNFGRIPTLEESIAGGGWLVGTDGEVLDGLEKLRDDMGLEYVLLEVEFPGMGRRRVAEQLDRIGNRIIPYLKQVPVSA